MFCLQNSAKIELAYSHALLVYIFTIFVSSIFIKKYAPGCNILTRIKYTFIIQKKLIFLCENKFILTSFLIVLLNVVCTRADFDVLITLHTCTGRDELTNNNIFLKTDKRINLSINSSVCENLCCLLE